MICRLGALSLALTLLIPGFSIAAQQQAVRAPEAGPAVGTEKHGSPVELRGPLPVPVEVVKSRSSIAAGKPAGGSCDGKDPCTLRLKPPAGQILIVTAVWSATRVQCDDLTTSTPADGEPITVAWRCEHELMVEGPGAGYAGFTIAR